MKKLVGLLDERWIEEELGSVDLMNKDPSQPRGLELSHVSDLL